MSKKLKIIFIFAFLFRILLAPLAEHPDVIDTLNWGKDLKENGMRGFYRRDVADAGPANYPPFYYVFSLTNQLLYENTKKIVWQINLRVPIFPSKIYLWFESQKGNIFFNKMPSILADIGLSMIIFRFIRKAKGVKIAEQTAKYILFLPPIWYLSSVWGQSDSIYALLIVIGLFSFFEKKWTRGAVLCLLSFLFKPTAIIVLPLFMYIYLKKAKLKDYFLTVSFSFILVLLLAYPFLEEYSLRAIIDLYKNNIREVTGYLVANSFNIWSLFYGLNPVSDSIKILGIRAYHWGEILFLGLLTFIIFKINLKSLRQVILSFSILSLGTYLVMTKMHERYYLLTVVFLAVILGLDKKVRPLFYLASGAFFVNLYHFWWMPRVNIIVEILSLNLVEKSLVFVNIFLFFKLIKIYTKNNSRISRKLVT